MRLAAGAALFPHTVTLCSALAPAVARTRRLALGGSRPSHGAVTTSPLLGFLLLYSPAAEPGLSAGPVARALAQRDAQPPCRRLCSTRWPCSSLSARRVATPFCGTHAWSPGDLAWLAFILAHPNHCLTLAAPLTPGGGGGCHRVRGAVLPAQEQADAPEAARCATRHTLSLHNPRGGPESCLEPRAPRPQPCCARALRRPTGCIRTHVRTQRQQLPPLFQST
jgi:hypothetical protein